MTMENQSFGQHLSELRKRLTWSAVVVAMATAVAFVFHQQILTVLMVPADGFTQTSNYKPVYTELTEFIGIAMKASLLVGIAISFPFLFLYNNHTLHIHLSILIQWIPNHQKPYSL